MGKSLMQFYADKCNYLLQNNVDFVLTDGGLNSYLSAFCIELLEISDLVIVNGKDHVINQEGVLFLQEGGLLTADDISNLFTVKKLKKQV